MKTCSLCESKGACELVGACVIEIRSRPQSPAEETIATQAAEIERLKGEVQSLTDRGLAHAVESEKWRTKFIMQRQEAQSDTWMWMGDEFDTPESLVCPVLMQPHHVREFVEDRADLSAARAALEKLLALCEKPALEAGVEVRKHWEQVSVIKSIIEQALAQAGRAEAKPSGAEALIPDLIENLEEWANKFRADLHPASLSLSRAVTILRKVHQPETPAL